MPILTSKEKNLTIFLLSTALIGSVVGIFRHNWLKSPEILLSPKNVPSYIKEIEEEDIIVKHNIMIKDPSQKSDTAVKNDVNIVADTEDNNSFKLVKVAMLNDTMNKTGSINKKKITQNTFEIININIASKEDFMMLPYIGEVKAERIIQLRNEIGTFVSVKDLEKVKGIGPKTLAKIEQFLTI
ncbi:helix-hairpin-helix domain-containing protein [bacterium]|nr:helix-hairpin-helix domain-containing protein [bacterium]